MDLISNAIGELLGGTGWRQYFVAGAFKGVPFQILSHSATFGRRLVVHEFPLREVSMVEDLGAQTGKFQVKAFVVGDDYPVERDALLKACTDGAKAGTLSHPYLGEFQARCESFNYRETIREGGYCEFDITFVAAGLVSLNSPDTVGGLLGMVKRVLGLARTVFAVAMSVHNLGDFVTRAALGYLGDIGNQLAGSWLGLPGLNLANLGATIEALQACDLKFPASPAALRAAPDPEDTTGTATAIAAPFTALADAAALAAGSAISASAGGSAIGASASTSRGESGPAPFWVGQLLLGQAGYVDAAPAIVATGSVVAVADTANRAAIEALVRDAAVAAAVQVYADTAWPSAEAAAAARDALADAIIARQDAAADAGNDDLYLGWQGLLAALMADYRARGLPAPYLAGYSMQASPSSLALACRLYDDATRADELAALNQAPHPAFLPRAGVGLAA